MLKYDILTSRLTICLGGLMAESILMGIFIGAPLLAFLWVMIRMGPVACLGLVSVLGVTAVTCGGIGGIVLLSGFVLWPIGVVCMLAGVVL